MAIKDKNKSPFCDAVQKILGLPGMLGWNRLGKFFLGLESEAAGIYRITRRNKKQIIQQMPFYCQWKPRTPNQIACAQFFKEGMIAWRNLTPEQKEVYNKRAKRYRIEGVNLFMREWMSSFRKSRTSNNLKNN
jgi:hypothetical protein